MNQKTDKKKWPMPKVKTSQQKKREEYAQKLAYDESVRDELKYLQFSVRR
jgi:hypothetical protein